MQDEIETVVYEVSKKSLLLNQSQLLVGLDVVEEATKSIEDMKMVYRQTNFK